jgi:hypothetical protein
VALTSKENRILRRQRKSLPTIIKEMSHLVTKYRKSLPLKEKENIKGDQEGCRLDLKPSPDAS